MADDINSSALFYNNMDELNKKAFDFELKVDDSDVNKAIKLGIAALIAKKTLLDSDANRLPVKTKAIPHEIVMAKTEKMADKVFPKFEENSVKFVYPKFPRNHVIYEINIDDMNPSMKVFFKSKDKEFFKNWFKTQAVSTMFTKTASEEEMEKIATTKNNASTLFLKSDISPICYFKSMFGKYKSTFLKMDAEILVKKIETDFSLEKFPINSIALNKILFIQNINANSKTFESPFAFEKLIRAFNSKPFDFFVKQSDGITPVEIAYTLHLANEVTPGLDIYKLFSKDTILFMAQKLYESDCLMFWPLEVSKGSGQLDLYRAINTEIARLLMTSDTGEADKLSISNDLKEILTKSKDIYSEFKQGNIGIDTVKTNIDAFKAQNLYIGNQIAAQVHLNVSMDTYIKNAKAVTNEQLQAYSLK